MTRIALIIILILAGCGGGDSTEDTGRVTIGTPDCTQGACK